jgi:hypothetical protein
MPLESFSDRALKLLVSALVSVVEWDVNIFWDLVGSDVWTHYKTSTEI